MSFSNLTPPSNYGARKPISSKFGSGGRPRLSWFDEQVARSTGQLGRLRTSTGRPLVSRNSGEEDLSMAVVPRGRNRNRDTYVAAPPANMQYVPNQFLTDGYAVTHRGEVDLQDNCVWDDPKIRTRASFEASPSRHKVTTHRGQEINHADTVTVPSNHDPNMMITRSRKSFDESPTRGFERQRSEHYYSTGENLPVETFRARALADQADQRLYESQQQSALYRRRASNEDLQGMASFASQYGNAAYSNALATVERGDIPNQRIVPGAMASLGFTQPQSTHNVHQQLPSQSRPRRRMRHIPSEESF